MYVLRGGVLDGVAGFKYCSMLADYERWTDNAIRARLREEHNSTN
jgi:hypothetical protein